MSDLVLTDVDADGIAVLTLNRPRRLNALAPDLRDALHVAVIDVMAREDVAAVIITGAEGRFCAGGDISQMVQPPIVQGRMRMEKTAEVVRAIANGAKPVIAAVEGVAYGGGLSLALACDYVIAAEDARLCASFVNVGLAPDYGLSYSLAMRVGASRAKRMCLRAIEVKGADALAIGMVDEVCPKGETLARAIAEAKGYVGRPPLAVALTKAAFARAPSSLDEALRTEVDFQSTLFRTEDHKEGVDAFLQKRKPVFRGR
ncbi:MAG: enoyl-CoA hydratase-related protein [Alphaproteobacteria bacterium]|nr:enoyl-CoA hydratase-related protein [Alphaproteobacteria bacterium]MDX5368660.1 enoyl-CoA hydratase-related protein [Alphaproteobacteria bacterium]MDX5463405.1 enoyl-CoA hydratase-related protein [Alphaproteobacteria bacterium]